MPDPDQQVPGRSPLPRSSAFHRYGPVVAVGVVLALVVGFATIGARDSASNASTAEAKTSAVDEAAAKKIPITYAQALARADVDNYDFTSDGKCDTRIGRLKVPTVYAPPCLAMTSKDGLGKPTSTGVTGKTIKVVYYIPAAGGVTSQLQAFMDPQEKQTATLKALVDMYNHVYQTWGRKVEIVPFHASGIDSDVEAARSDALKVANDIKPFASIGGPQLTPAYSDELAKQKVLCIGCGLAVPDSYFQKNAPYMWGMLASPEQYLVNIGDYITYRLQGGKASFGGPDVKDKTRVFGIVHFEQDPPVFQQVSKVVLQQGEKRGFHAAVNETYVLDPPKLPERAATIIAKMKAAGVTTIVFLGDPLMPISLTQQATKQNYFPEWVVTGTVLTDTTTLGRAYDQKQWAHAFGLSNLAVRLPLEQQDPYRLYQWYFGKAPEAPKTIALIYQALFPLFTGIDMAGPDLTPQTFQAGLFNYPATGGGATTPRISWGTGLFANPDYQGIDDSTEIWWDANAKGPNEQGGDGTGMWRYADGGKRYLPYQMPKTPPHAFIQEGSVTDFKTPPPEDAPPQYPSPRKGG
jgi:hypothetical protein